MFVRINPKALLASGAALVILTLSTGSGCPNTGAPIITPQQGQVTVTVIDAVNGPTTNWARFVSLGDHTIPIWKAMKSPPDSTGKPFIDLNFHALGDPVDRFIWQSYVSSISSGVTVPASPPGFASGFKLTLVYTYDDMSLHTLNFTAYEGTVNITDVNGNVVTFRPLLGWSWMEAQPAPRDRWGTSTCPCRAPRRWRTNDPPVCLSR